MVPERGVSAGVGIPSPKARPSVLILTFDEEDNLAEALESVLGWADDVVIVDSFSSDRTVDLALAFRDRGVRVYQHRFDNYSAQLNWALETIFFKQDWILRLDADERMTSELRQEITALLKGGPAHPAYHLHWRLVFMGRRLRWGGYDQTWTIRLWQKASGRYEDREVNEHFLVQGSAGYLRHPIDHHDSKSLSRWLERHNRYAAMEAAAIHANNLTGGVPPRFFGTPPERRMWLRRAFYRSPLRSTIYFLYRYVLKLGALDGKAGFRFAFLHSAFFYWITLHLAEIQRTGQVPQVIRPHRGAPHPGAMAAPETLAEHARD